MKRKNIKVRMRFRRAGWAALLILFLVQMAAFNTGENLFYLLGGILLGFVIVSALIGRLSMAGLRLSRDLPETVHRGESFLSLLRIENRKFIFPPGALRISSASGSENAKAYLDRIPSRRAALVRLTDLYSRRGLRPAPPVTVSTGYPFGLIDVTLTHSEPVTVTVYPRIHTIKKAELDQLEGLGVIPRVNQGEGDEFYSLRDYIPGDEIRRIAWKVSARRRKLIVRELEPNTSRSIMIIFDTQTPEYNQIVDDDFEETVDLVASLAAAFLARQYTVGLATPGASTPLGLGNAHYTKIMELLARVEATNAEASSTDWYIESASTYAAANIFISPDPSRWGRPAALRGTRFLKPGNFAHV